MRVCRDLCSDTRSCQPSVVNEIIRMHVEPRLSDPLLVAAFEGWNDAGESATTAVQYLDAAIQSVPLAEIDTESYFDLTVRRPMARFDKSGQRVIDWPTTRFRYGAADGQRDIVVVQGVEPHMRWREYCEHFATIVRKLRVRRIVLLGAYVADVVYSRPVSVNGVASSGDLLDRVGVAPSKYEGPTGIVGALAERLALDGAEVVSLWAGLPHYISVAPNPRGALALVQHLTACARVVIDEAPLRAEAAAFEERISALVSGDPELIEYVRQLKRREFAQ